ncbi:hypothetical protein BJ742DRAFT_744681 [Cladochytrium replicatum]|nr:hypothetical protein BJ742DRAFT_744681 [Cladochytrium replicatum]
MELPCLCLGDPPEKAFVLKAEKSDRLSELKLRIAERLRPRYHLAAEDLVLYKLNEPLPLHDDRLSLFVAMAPKEWPDPHAYIDLIKMENPLKKLSFYFNNPLIHSDLDDDDLLQVLVILPAVALSPPSDSVSSSLARGNNDYNVPQSPQVEPPPYESSLSQMTNFFHDIMQNNPRDSPSLLPRSESRLDYLPRTDSSSNLLLREKDRAFAQNGAEVRYDHRQNYNATTSSSSLELHHAPADPLVPYDNHRVSTFDDIFVPPSTTSLDSFLNSHPPEPSVRSEPPKMDLPPEPQVTTTRTYVRASRPSSAIAAKAPVAQSEPIDSSASTSQNAPSAFEDIFANWNTSLESNLGPFDFQPIEQQHPMSPRGGIVTRTTTLSSAPPSATSPVTAERSSMTSVRVAVRRPSVARMNGPPQLPLPPLPNRLSGRSTVSRSNTAHSRSSSSDVASRHFSHVSDHRNPETFNAAAASSSSSSAANAFSADAAVHQQQQQQQGAFGFPGAVPGTFRAVLGYIPSNPATELEISEGDTLDVLEVSVDGHWCCGVNQSRGTAQPRWFPITCISFSCMDCQELVRGDNFYPFRDPSTSTCQILCERDYNRRLVHFQQSRQQQQQQQYSVCASCGGHITAEHVSTTTGRKYHPEHFVCGVCQDPLDRDRFFEEDAGVYCERCYGEKVARRCEGCGLPLIVDFVETRTEGEGGAERREAWHAECDHLHQLWNVKLGQRITSPSNAISAEGIVDLTAQVTELVSRILTVLDGFEKSLSQCITDMVLSFIKPSSELSSESRAMVVREAERLVRHVEALFISLDVHDARDDGAESRAAYALVTRWFQLLRPAGGSSARAAAKEVVRDLGEFAGIVKRMVRVAMDAALTVDQRACASYSDACPAVQRVLSLLETSSTAFDVPHFPDTTTLHMDLCKRCLRRIDSACVRAGPWRWHLACVSCATCSSPLPSLVTCVHGAPYCGEHAPPVSSRGGAAFENVSERQQWVYLLRCEITRVQMQGKKKGGSVAGVGGGTTPMVMPPPPVPPKTVGVYREQLERMERERGGPAGSTRWNGAETE